MAEESLKRRKQRALNGIIAQGQITPGELADWLNGPRDIYPKLPEISTDDARDLLEKLHKDEQIVSAGGSRYKLKGEASGEQGSEGG